MKLGSAGAMAAGAVIALAMQAGLGAQEALRDAFTLDGERAYLGLPLHFDAKAGGDEYIHLWGKAHTIGVQSLTTYMRSAANFAWYKGGKHTADALEPGEGGSEMMRLSGGNLTVAGRIEAEMGTVPKGAIMMWSGSVEALPAGWRLADGAPNITDHTVNGVTIPDLRGRFVVGQGGGDADYETIGATGGVKTVKVPNHAHQLGERVRAAGSHTHVVTSWGDHTSTSSGTQVTAVDGYDGTNTTSGWIDVQTPDTLDNRPPYYVLAYIIYIGV